MTHNEIQEYCLSIILVAAAIGLLAAVVGGIIWMIIGLAGLL